MKTKKMKLYDAYLYFLDKRDIIRPNEAFLKQLDIYERKLFDGKSTLNKVQHKIRNNYFQHLTK